VLEVNCAGVLHNAGDGAEKLKI